MGWTYTDRIQPVLNLSKQKKIEKKNCVEKNIRHLSQKMAPTLNVDANPRRIRSKQACSHFLPATAYGYTTTLWY